MDDWQLLILGGAISTVTAGVVQWWQGRQARDRQADELAHQRERQRIEFSELRARQQEEWERQRTSRHELEQREVLRELQAEAFKLVFAARAFCDENVSIANAEQGGPNTSVTVEGRRETIRQFEASRARAYVLGASVQCEAIRSVVGELIPMAESLAFTPRERHGNPDPYYRIIEVRNELNVIVGRLLRGGPGIEISQDDSASTIK